MMKSAKIDCPRALPVCRTLSKVSDSVGSTPLILLEGLSKKTGCTVFAKAEFLNPGGSVKDRIALFMVEQAEKRGELRPGATLLEVTSGNTGIALAMVGVMKGYHVVIMMPKTVSEERRSMISAFGAELRLFEEVNRIQDAVRESEELAKKDDSIFLLRQFANPDNPLCHETTTGPEILLQVEKPIDAFVMGVGTGGTLMGVGRALRKGGSKARIVAVEPDESAVLSGGPAGRHGIQGLADGFIPDIIRRDEIDDVVRIPTKEAKERGRRLGKEEGLLVGISSGANVLAAEVVAKGLGPGHTIVTVLPDRGERYLSLAS